MTYLANGLRLFWGADGSQTRRDGRSDDRAGGWRDDSGAIAVITAAPASNRSIPDKVLPMSQE
ncbi:hypothetical protein CN186_08650 [Sinorhizobium medicae]|nr:hypothetical protein CN186_08650 [Sinorhizobium medicae]